MGYTGHASAPPRSILVIVGGMIAWGGILSGFFITTPELHRSLTTSEQPVEMTWQQLVDNGLTDNCHVRLVDVALEERRLDEALDGEIAEDLAEMMEAMAVFQEMGPWGDNLMTMFIKVYPKDRNPADVPEKVVIPVTPWSMDAAFAEVKESGTLTGRFSLTSEDGFENQLAEFFMGDQPAWLEGQNQPIREPHYIYEPLSSVTKLADARNWFCLSFLAVVLGLVINGAGGPSIACCIFFQVPSILSLLGYPMRYGRAGTMTRIIYAFIGVGLTSYGYQSMFVAGRIGHLDGHIGACVVGYLQMSIGSAALLGALINLLAEKLNVSIDPKSSKKKNAAPKITLEQACAMHPPEAEAAKSYVDPELVTDSDSTTPESLGPIRETLSALEFSDPEPVAWHRADGSQPALIQLGCQEMVLADVQLIDGQPQSRLVSVLHDGMAIITLSPNFPNTASRRFGSAGLYTVGETDGLQAMLSSHLQQTIEMAEKRDTSVVSIDPSETIDVCLLARRVLNDIRTQYGEENLEVGPGNYGRFRFPPQPVSQSALMSV